MAAQLNSVKLTGNVCTGHHRCRQAHCRVKLCIVSPTPAWRRGSDHGSVECDGIRKGRYLRTLRECHHCCCYITVTDWPPQMPTNLTASWWSSTCKRQIQAKFLQTSGKIQAKFGQMNFGRLGRIQAKFWQNSGKLQNGNSGGEGS